MRLGRLDWNTWDLKLICGTVKVSLQHGIKCPRTLIFHTEAAWRMILMDEHDGWMDD